MFLQRRAVKQLMKASSQFGGVFVLGARRCGKTTLLKHACGNTRTYVTLENPFDRALAQQQPELFLTKYKPPVCIDGVHHAPQLMPHIRSHVTQSKKTGQFWLAGLPHVAMMPSILRFLKNIFCLDMLPLSHKELQHRPHDKPFVPQSIEPIPMTPKQWNAKKDPQIHALALYRRMWQGSYPAVVLGKVPRNRFYQELVNHILETHVPNPTQQAAFLQFLRVCASRSSRMMHLHDMAQEAHIGVKQAKQWLWVLEQERLIHRLWRPIAYNMCLKGFQREETLYFWDTGLCAYLLEMPSWEALADGPQRHAFFKTHVVSEIAKSHDHSMFHRPLSCLRHNSGQQVDLLIQHEGRFCPVQISTIQFPTAKEMASFQLLKKARIPPGHGALICLDSVSWTSQKYHTTVMPAWEI